MLPDIYEAEDMYPEALTAELTHSCYAATIPASHTGQIYTNQTGRFHKPASSGVTQMFILYDYNSNSIHAVAMKTKTAEDILQAYYEIVYKQLVKGGFKPKLHRLDNECSTLLHKFMEDHNITVQLVPPCCV